MIIFLYGANTYKSRQKLNELKNKFRREIDPGERSLAVIDGEKATVDKINEAVKSSSLFTRKTMVIVENIFANKSPVILDNICEYLKKEFTLTKKIKEAVIKEDTGNIIIFWDSTSGEKLGKNKLFNFLSKERFAQNFKLLSNPEVAAWIKAEVEARGGKIKPQAVMYLASLFGNDQWQLSQEIDKVINYKQGQNRELLPGSGDITIDVRDAEDLCRGQSDENIFALTDAISRKNKSLAIKLFEQEIESGVTETYLLHMIIRQFRILLQVKEALEQGHSSRKIISDLKLHPFVAQKGISQAGGFTLGALKNIFHHLVEVDRQIKTGQGDFKTNIDLLVAKI